MGQRQVEAHRHRQAGGHEPLSGPRPRLAVALARWIDAPRVIDSPAFPAFDVSCPARDPGRARDAAEGLAACPLVLTAEVGPSAFVHVRWLDEVLVASARSLEVRAADLAPLPASRAWRRCLTLHRMARREHGDLTCTPRFDDMRPLLVRLEWFASTARHDVRRRLSREIAADFEARYTSTTLLRGPSALVAGRVRVALAVAAALQIAAWPHGRGEKDL